MNSDAFSTADNQKSSDDTELEVLGQSSAAPHGSLGVTPSAKQGGNTPLGDKNLSGVTPVDINQEHQPDGLHGSSQKQKQIKTQNQGSSLNKMLPKFSGGNPSQNSASASGDVHDAPLNADFTPEKPTNFVLSEAPDQPSPFLTNGLSEILNQTRRSELTISVNVTLTGAEDVIIEELLPQNAHLLKLTKSDNFMESLQERLEPAIVKSWNSDVWNPPIVDGKPLNIPHRSSGSKEFYEVSSNLLKNMEPYENSLMQRMCGFIGE